MAPIEYLNDLGQARAVESVRNKYVQSCEKKLDTDNGLFSGSKNTDGYGQNYTKSNASIA
ncbi:hypothetical protein LTR10_015434 [Elasticomyces elasticus]|uniref:Uncharacterized protein n=1 Tax=Exophiala sideris TaxID=1016849 RepID=A0ABR0J4H4_9EURO|nr:hypothetical protein LTR10_015434 [Elasticomyces elasticus]KAK5026974.1 hypothetical protein LTS07_007273 [Exophiala sideris]KAK5033978.1 hypothetical protein LTR13_006578 [Exophiala sideris]KAK5055748.1 hypothetical protein LTR69_008123 [Exophiala sideris]KAK5180920.1 hypothetical protein LTR44_006740 [Eurotiomycetes sp. CCFEE 6388]